MLIQRAFLPSMPDDMLAVAQQTLGPMQWYCKSNTEEKNVLSYLNYVWFSTFMLILLLLLPKFVQMVTPAPLERYIIFILTHKKN